MDDEHTRRRFTQLTGIALGAAVAGCSGPTADASESDATTAATTTSDDSGSSDSSGDSEFVETSSVDVTDELTFEPKRIQVSAGTTVTWTNTGSIGHTVTAYEDEIPDGAAYFASGGFDSEQAAKDGYSDGQQGNLTGGDTYEHTFETKGTYKYYCIPHELNGMVGFVKVV